MVSYKRFPRSKTHNSKFQQASQRAPTLLPDKITTSGSEGLSHKQKGPPQQSEGPWKCREATSALYSSSVNSMSSMKS